MPATAPDDGDELAVGPALPETAAPPELAPAEPAQPPAERDDLPTYRVTGPNRVDGHAMGETYTADYSAEHEKYLTTAGHVERVRTGDTPDQQEET